MINIPQMVFAKAWQSFYDLFYRKKTDAEVHELLSHVVEDDGQGCAPLILAARHGHFRMVKMLLSQCNTNIEQEGTVNFDGKFIEGASALWCAAGAGHLNVVKILVNSGANVNHPTSTNSTPLRAACFYGRLDIVRYLTDHNANIHIVNKYNNTCLMIAANKGHLDVVSFLLEKGANPDEKAHCGATALHFAAECGHVGIVKELLEYGAQLTKNVNGMSPLIVAADSTRSEVVEYLVARPEVSHKEKIEALELLGASFANDNDNYSLDRAYVYLHRSMEMRFLDPNDIVLKKLCNPVPAYENWVECQSLEELEAIQFNQNALHMESLSIRERILGTHNPEVSLCCILSEKSDAEVNELLNHVVEDDGQGCAPLILAARHGHFRMVKMLLSQCNTNIEQEGTVNFDGKFIEGASALWCAAGAGHLNVVKILVNSGANVNHPTSTNSTPLRAACFYGRLDIVRYLTDHNANIHIVNKYNNTCLMIAANKGHLDVVSFLLEKGANPDEKAHCGATALHFAAECGHVGIVKELLEYGAQITKNVNGMSPLIVAADRTRSEVVEYLVTLPEFSYTERVEAVELLGASFANDNDNYSLERAYVYLHRSMEMRFLDANDIVLKKLCKPVPAYENWVECQSLKELEAIQFNQNALHMESLSIRERILGTHNPEVPHPVVYRGAVFVDNARFDRCIELWLHALHLRQLNKVSVVKDLLRFAQVFSQMIHVGVELAFSQVEDVLLACVVELERNRAKIADPGPKDDVKQITEELDKNMTTVLYILVIKTKFMKKCIGIEEFRLRRIVRRLNKLRVSTSGQSLLQLCLNADTPVDDFYTNKVVKFPCATTAMLLIQCGADVNSLDHSLKAIIDEKETRRIVIRRVSRK